MQSGAPTKLNDVVKKKILVGIAGLLTNKLAAHLAGVCEKTFYNWMERGKHDIANCDDTDYARFLQDIRKIRAEKALNIIAGIQDCCERWQALDRLLVRCFREDYGYDCDEIRELRSIISELAQKRGIEIEKSTEERDDDVCN